MEQRVKPLIKGALRHALLCTASCLQRQHADTTGSGSARQMGLLQHGEKGGRKLEAGAHRYGFKLLAADFILDEHLDVYLLSFCENFELDLPQSKVVSSLNVVTVHMQLVSCACGCQRPVGRPTDVPTAVLRDFLHVLLQLLLCASWGRRSDVRGQQEVDQMLKRMMGEAIDIAVQANQPGALQRDASQVQCVEGFEYLYDKTADTW